MCVRSLKVGIGLVLRVANAIVVEGSDLCSDVLAHAPFYARLFIDVVAKVENDVELVLAICSYAVKRPCS